MWLHSHYPSACASRLTAGSDDCRQPSHRANSVAIGATANLSASEHSRPDSVPNHFPSVDHFRCCAYRHSRADSDYSAHADARRPSRHSGAHL